MSEFTQLISQLLFIALVQIALTLIINADTERPVHVKILNAACIMGSLYFLLQFAFQYLLGAITSFITFPL